jgi:hypothetical protein
MAKSRDKTQQIGFWDPEVSAPDHDEVCLWAYRKADEILRAAYPNEFDRAWLPQEIPNGAHQFAAEHPRPNPRVEKRTIEYVLKSFTGYRDSTERIVGYADLLIKSAIPAIRQLYTPSPLRGGDDVFNGFAVSWETERWTPSVLVEAKSFLPTVGELMRQINLYRTAFKGPVVIVSPDDSYADLLHEQAVLFIKYQKSGV